MPFSLYPHFTGDPYEKSFDFIDTVLLSASEQTSFRYEELIEESNLPQLEKDIAKHINSHLRNLITNDLKYIETLPNNIWQSRLTPLGLKVKKAGGHFAYLKSLSDKDAEDKERQERKDKSDKYDLLNKKWQYKTKLLPYIVSVLALTVSIVSYFKPEKKQLDLQPMQQKIQLLQDRVKQLDSLFRVDTLLKKGN